MSYCHDIFLDKEALYRNGTLHNNRHFCTNIKPPSVKCRRGLAYRPYQGFR